MAKSFGVIFNRKSGAILKTIEGSSSLLRLYAMNNLTKTKDYVVFNGTTGIIEGYFEGKTNDLPNICRDMEGKHINEIANGLLEALTN